jgi:hypothetical protein
MMYQYLVEKLCRYSGHPLAQSIQFTWPISKRQLGSCVHRTPIHRLAMLAISNPDIRHGTKSGCHLLAGDVPQADHLTDNIDSDPLYPLLLHF